MHWGWTGPKRRDPTGSGDTGNKRSVRRTNCNCKTESLLHLGNLREETLGGVWDGSSPTRGLAPWFGTPVPEVKQPLGGRTRRGRSRPLYGYCGWDPDLRWQTKESEGLHQDTRQDRSGNHDFTPVDTCTDQRRKRYRRRSGRNRDGARTHCRRHGPTTRRSGMTLG